MRMPPWLLCTAIFPAAACVATAPIQETNAPIEISDAEALAIGQRIWENEGNRKIEWLSTWFAADDYGWLGIGHFIWYPPNATEKFDETFPSLLAFFEQKGVSLPDWLKGSPPCPWKTPAEYNRDEPRKKELAHLMEATIGLQARWIVDRLQRTLPKMLDSLPEGRRERVRRQFDRVARSPGGYYALIDYLNFKGAGISPNERYKGEGWGLIQVLEGMKGSRTGSKALGEFASSAEKVLKRRIKNSPPERHEERWLSNFLHRVGTYRTSTP